MGRKPPSSPRGEPASHCSPPAPVVQRLGLLSPPHTHTHDGGSTVVTVIQPSIVGRTPAGTRSRMAGPKSGEGESLSLLDPLEQRGRSLHPRPGASALQSPSSGRQETQGQGWFLLSHASFLPHCTHAPRCILPESSSSGARGKARTFPCLAGYSAFLPAVFSLPWSAHPTPIACVLGSPQPSWAAEETASSH